MKKISKKKGISEGPARKILARIKNKETSIYIPPHEIVIEKKHLGSESFVEGQWQSTPILLQKMSKDSLLIDMRILKNLRHPSITTFYGIYKTPEVNYLVTELMQLGKLRKFLESNQLKPSELVHLCSSISAGLSYLSNNKIICGNLTSDDIYIKIEDGKYIAKITNFGIKRRITTGKYQKWLAIETFKHSKFTAKSDVWSMGIIFWEIFTHQEPYKGINEDIILDRLNTGFRLPKIQVIPESIYQVMTQCWEKDEEKRPSAETIYKSLHQIEIDEFGLDESLPSSSKEQTLNNDKGLYSMTKSDHPTESSSKSPYQNFNDQTEEIRYISI